MFICVRGLDVSSPTGSQIAHKLMKMTQKAAYTMVRLKGWGFSLGTAISRLLS